MRILHTIADKGLSGQENRILATALWQAQNGHDVIVAASKDSGLCQKILDKGLKLVELPQITSASTITQVCHNEQAHLIDAHGETDASAAASAELPVPVVRTLHSHLTETNLAAHQRMVWNHLEHVIAVDASIERQLLDKGLIYSRRVSVISEQLSDFDSKMQKTVAIYENARRGFTFIAKTSSSEFSSNIESSLLLGQSTQAILERLIKKISEAPIDQLPSENIYIEDVFEHALYAQILKRLPRDADYDDISHPDAVTPQGIITRKFLDLSDTTIERLAPANRNFWHQMKSILSSEELLDAIVQKFGTTIEARFGKGCPRLSLVPVFYRDYPGYRISIHPDSVTKVATLQFYLPADDAQVHLGTTFHLKNGTKFEEYKTNPFKPNSAYAFVRTNSSWHSVKPIAADEKIRNSLALTVFIEGQEVTAKARDKSLFEKTLNLGKRISSRLRLNVDDKRRQVATAQPSSNDEKIKTDKSQAIAGLIDFEERDYKLLFDKAWYVQRYPDVLTFGDDPFKHFLDFGRKEKRDPNSLFNSEWYLAQNPDVKDLNLDPLTHFIKIGAAEKRAPNPLFDTEWYLRHYPQVASSGINPLAHYLQYGVSEGKYPNPLFDTKWYVGQYPDVVAAGVNPLAHYLNTGAFEGKNPNPFFESRWYLEQYPEVAKIGINPLVHYLKRGSSEGKDPGPQFCGQLYLTQCPDIAAANINPLVHYIHHGRYESRMAHIQLQPQSSGIPHKYSANSFDQFMQLRANEPYLRGRFLKSIAFAKSNASPVVSIIIPLNRQMHKIARCLWALSKQHSSYPYEVIVVADDVNADDGQAILSRIPGLKYCRTNFVENFIASCNKGAREATGKYLVFLHNDAEVLPGWLDALIDTFDKHSDSGLVCSKILLPDGGLHDACGSGCGDADPDRPEYNFVRYADGCSSTAVAMRKDVFDVLGGFNAHHSYTDYLDNNLTAMVTAAGWSTLYQPFAACVWHGALKTNEQAISTESRNETGKTKAVKPKVLFLDADIPMAERDARSWNVPYLFEFLTRQGYESTFICASLTHAGYHTQRLQKAGVECHYLPYLDSIPTFFAECNQHFDIICLLHVTIFEKYAKILKAKFPEAQIVLSYAEAVEIPVLESAAR
jgi:GT2 family glycosyltransferase